MKKYSGKFITFEGIDGCGKSTQINFLEKVLKNKGKQVILIREPGGTQIGEKIRNIILDIENKEMSFTAEMLMYAAARAQLIEQVIEPALKDGKIVLCDRFVDSSYVYQGIARGLGIDIVESINNIAIHGIMPDITLFFDVSPEVSLKRRLNVSKADRIEKEKIDFHNMVYKGYKLLSQKYPERIKCIDAGQEIDKVQVEVNKYISELL